MTVQTDKRPVPPQTPFSRRKSVFSMGADFSPSTYIFISACAFLLLLALWLLVTGLGLLKPIFLPSPAAVLARLGKLAADGTLASDIGNSVYRIMVGFLIASAMALATAILIGAYRFW